MNTKQAVSFDGQNYVNRRPDLLPWAVLGLVLILCQWMAAKIHFNLWAVLAAVFLLIHLPALFGCLAGWFLGGVRLEMKGVSRVCKIRFLYFLWTCSRSRSLAWCYPLLNVAHMRKMPHLFRFCFSLATACSFAAVWSLHAASASPEPINYNRDIRPILSANCFYCHGPDEEHQEADLRLDHVQGATKDLGGYQAVVPGDAEASEVIKRILADDHDDLMPPLESDKEVNKSLKKHCCADGFKKGQTMNLTGLF
jgi:hypothetical protein